MFRYYLKPTKQKRLRSFLGTVTYYHRLIPDLAKWVVLFRFHSLKNGNPCFIEWNICLTDAFDHLVIILCDEHTLPFFRSEDKFVLHRYASMPGIGKVLSMNMRE